MSNNGGYAFPTDGTPYRAPGDGMSLRDYFAAAALQGMVLRYGPCTNPPMQENEARNAYAYADAMLKERAK